MENFTKTTWLSIQKAKRRRQRAERIKTIAEQAMIFSILALAACGLVAIILALLGFKFSKPAEAAQNITPVVIENIQPATEKAKEPEQKKEKPQLTDDEITKTLKKVCSANGMEDKENNEVCWQTLWAMSYQESKLGWLPTGDGGKSKGWFHIQTKLHNVSEECAMDLNCSADWTLKRLISKGFPIYWTYSVQAHNGFGTEAAKRGEYAKIIEKEIAALNN